MTVSGRNKLVLFLGSNIGNFSPEDATRFLQALNDQLQTGDLLLMGIDIKKHPKDILAAYNDSAGITKAFNLNLLNRINTELGADFDLAKFDHYPTYNPITGACKSYLISLEEQDVHINGDTISFSQYEPVWTELSQKYDEQEIADLAAQTGFRTVNNYFDQEHRFVDTLWEKV